jgi:hypothetical protein
MLMTPQTLMTPHGCAEAAREAAADLLRLLLQLPNPVTEQQSHVLDICFNHLDAVLSCDEAEARARMAGSLRLFLQVGTVLQHSG